MGSEFTEAVLTLSRAIEYVQEEGQDRGFQGQKGQLAPARGSMLPRLSNLTLEWEQAALPDPEVCILDSVVNDSALDDDAIKVL
jgi:hypothetical protein